MQIIIEITKVHTLEITFSWNCNFETPNYYTDTDPVNVYHAFKTTGPNLIGT